MIDGGYFCNRCGCYSTYKHSDYHCLLFFEKAYKNTKKKLEIAESLIDFELKVELEERYKKIK